MYSNRKCGGSRKNSGCGCSGGFIRDIYERSLDKKLTTLARDEWLERLNDLINNGVVSTPNEDNTSVIASAVIGTMVIGSN